MKTKRFSVVAFLIALVMSITCFGACSATQNNNSSQTSSTEQEASASLSPSSPSTGDDKPTWSDSEESRPSTSTEDSKPSTSTEDSRPTTPSTSESGNSSSSSSSEEGGTTPSVNKYTVSVTGVEGITITVKKGETALTLPTEVDELSSITLSYTLDTGYTFNNFTVNGQVYEDTSVTVIKNTVISASVTHDVYTVTVNSCENGSVSIDKKTAHYGETITLSNSPNDYYKLKEYLVNGSAITGNTFTMPTSNVTISANFVYDGSFSVANGNVSESNGSLTTTASDTLAIKKLETFSSGTLSAKIFLNGKNNADNGIVFSVTNPSDLSSYWETGVSYYFFFISKQGEAYLGKVTDGAWSICGHTVFNVNYNSTYTLSVSIEKGTSQDVIKCFVNDVLYVSYADGNKLSGTGYGIRAGASDITYSNFEISSTIKGQTDGYSDYAVRNGSFAAATNGLKSSSGNALATRNNAYFKYGTLSAKVTLGGTVNDCGLVFGLTSSSTSYWEGNGVSYYFLFISSTGYLSLGKTNNGAWSNSGWIKLNGFSSTASYTLKVVRDDAAIYCYVNDALYITFAENTMLTGMGYGVRAGASNVTFSEIKNLSSEYLRITRPTDLTTVNGDFRGVNGNVVAGRTNSIATLSEMTSGTLTVNVTGVSNGDSGVIFAYSDNNNYYKFYTSRSTQTVKLAKVENGTTTVLYSNYLSAGYYETGPFTFKVVIRENKAHCYFFNTLYVAQNIALSGNKVGLYSANSGTIFTNYSVSSNDTVTTCDTLLFGHSYFELWDDWQDDFNYVSSQVTGFGSFTNIGIGGSQASHWLNFKDALLCYNFKKAVYMIGINDLSAGVSPQMTVNNITELLLFLKQQIPELTVVLVGVNQCNARHTDCATFGGVDVHNQVTQTNVLLRTFVAQYDWINFAETENLFCENGVPQAKWFKDGLHPTSGSNHGSSTDGYRDLLVPAIISAWKGENQPTISETEKNQLLVSAKNVKLCSLANYSQDAYRNAEWVTAQPIYNEAVAKIYACATVAEVNALDLSSYITRLAQIKNNAQYTLEEIINQNATNDGSYYNDYLWQDNTAYPAFNTSSGVKYNMSNFGHVLDGNVSYSDLSFTLKLTENSGTVAIAGALFRATQTSGRGVNGYLINFVSDMNHVQIFYLNNYYNASGTPAFQYLGGWVYPGNVVGTTFRVVVKGTICRVYTEEDYVKYGEDAYGCSADLTSGAQYYGSGYFGLVGWNENVSCKLEVANLLGSACHSVYTSSTTAQTVMGGIISGTDAIINGNTAFSNGLSSSTGNTITTTGEGHVLNDSTYHSDVHVSFKVNYSGDIDLVGILLRAQLTSNNGINGYLVNIRRNASANEYFLQFFALNDYMNNNGNLGCQYLGGWVVPGEVINTTFHVSIIGNKVYISADYLGVCDPITLTATSDQPVYTTGYFGLHNRNDKTSSITVSNLSYGASVKDEVTQGIVDANNVYSNVTNITDNNGALHTKNGCYSLYNGVLASDFTMQVTVSGVSKTGLPFNETNNTQAGFLFRAHKNASYSGIDGYFLNFVADETHQYVQLFYINNGYNYSNPGAPEQYVYIGGWIYPGYVVDTTFTVQVANDVVYISSSTQTEVVELTLTGNSQGLSHNLPVYKHGGFGILTYHSLDLNFNSIILN